MEYIGWLILIMLFAAVARMVFSISGQSSKSSYDLEMERIQKRKKELGIDDSDPEITPKKKNIFISILLYAVCIIGGIFVGLVAIGFYIGG